MTAKKDNELPLNSLELTPEQRRNLQQSIANYIEDFLENISYKKAYIENGYEKTADDENFMIDDAPKDISDLLQLIENRVDNTGLNPASGGHLGYIPGGGIYTSSLGDYIAAVTNRYAGIFYASPGAVRMENAVIDWVGKLIGFTGKFGGNITSGGSIANLIALSTAKIAFNLKSRDIENAVIYTTHQSHHSIQKALRMLGLDECIIRFIELDENFRMQTKILEKQINIDRESKLIPFLIIANAGSTDVGAVDDLQTISKIAKEGKLWLHIDAAYGGFFLLTDHGKKIFKGIENADSVTLDPHKGLFLPYGAGMVIVKELRNLIKANHYEANYMQDAENQQEEISPAEVSPELSRNFRGMRLWLPLKLHGVQPFRDCLTEKLNLIQYFCGEIEKLGFELGNKPDLTVAIFRWKAKNREDINREILKQIHADGTVFISSTNINGEFWLRIAILSFRTHQREIDQLLDILKRAILN